MPLIIDGVTVDTVFVDGVQVEVDTVVFNGVTVFEAAPNYSFEEDFDGVWPGNWTLGFGPTRTTSTVYSGTYSLEMNYWNATYTNIRAHIYQTFDLTGLTTVQVIATREIMCDQGSGSGSGFARTLVGTEGIWNIYEYVIPAYARTTNQNLAFWQGESGATYVGIIRLY